jgi:hypothetical protein
METIMTTEKEGGVTDPVLEADTQVLDALQNSPHGLVSKAMVVCGTAAVLTTCACALIFFGTCVIHVWRNNAWPPNVGWGITSVMLVGPVLTAWQFMGVRKILTSIFSDNNSLGSIVKEVVARKIGMQPIPPKSPDEPSA